MSHGLPILVGRIYGPQNGFWPRTEHEGTVIHPFAAPTTLIPSGILTFRR
jgi:hypothetical protein